MRGRSGPRSEPRAGCLSGAGWVTRLDTRVRYAVHSRRGLRAAGLALGFVVGAGLVWICVTAVMAKQATDRAQGDVAAVVADVHAEPAGSVRTALERIEAQAHRAHRLTTGPAWWLAAHVPYLGRPALVARGATSAMDALTRGATPALSSLAGGLSPDRLRTGGTSLDLQQLRDAAPRLTDARGRFSSAGRAVGDLPHTTWLAPVDHLRADLDREIGAVGGYLQTAQQAARILPPMLGDNGSKRYFVALQNEAEARGTGGIPGAFAIMVADHGTLRFTHFGSDTELSMPATPGLVPTHLDLGAAYGLSYGFADPTSLFENSDISPNFPDAAKIWAAMWQRVSGQRIDGAISADPTTLGYLLKVSGPATLPDGTQVTADNVVTLTEKTLYSRFTNPVERKAYLIKIVSAAETRLAADAGQASAFIDAASRAGHERRLLAWSTDPSVEAALSGTIFGGVVERSAQPYTGVVLNNTTSGKLDYYLHRSLTYQSSGCGSTRDVLATVSIANGAPASGLPAYVVDRLDHSAGPTRPGDTRVLLDYVATTGAQLLGATLNGRPVDLGVIDVEGHPGFRLDLDLPRAATQTLVLHLSEPFAGGRVHVLNPPGSTPSTVTIDDLSCR